MSYRMSNTEKWKDLWFSNLSPHGKLLFFYFVENCDNAGFFEVNKKFMLFHTGFTEQELLSAGTEIKKSYIRSKDGNKLWFKNFLKYQKKLPLNSLNNSHKQIISLLQENLSDETKFKGNEIMNSLLPADSQIGKRRRTEVVKPTQNQNETENKTETPASKIERFVKPSRDDVYNYMVENEFEMAKSESHKFVNFYESKGWKVGKNTMKIWRSAVAGWIQNYYDRNKIKTDKTSKLEAIQKSHEEMEKIDWKEEFKDIQNEQFN
jgi:hypothetical protein